MKQHTKHISYGNQSAKNIWSFSKNSADQQRVINILEVAACHASSHSQMWMYMVAGGEQIFNSNFGMLFGFYFLQTKSFV